MRLITSVHVRGFRSLADVRLDDLSNFVALVGPNNSGKSNVFRALNLFFNNELDKDSYLDLSADCHMKRRKKPELAGDGKASRQRKQKVISVAVRFIVPDGLNFFSKNLQPVAKFLGKDFWIRKTWAFDSLDEPVLAWSRNGRRFEPVQSEDSRRKIRQFLGLISFRYVSNRAVPADVVKHEWRAVQAQLGRRMSMYERDAVFPFERLRSQGNMMVESFMGDVRDSLQIEDLELATPKELGELIFYPSGLRIVLKDAGTIEDTFLGAGAQSILMFCMLHMIDKAKFQGFGWNQASIWAIEEPESSLHRDLQLKAAALLRSYSESDRFQVLVTTHNEIFIESASCGFGVTLDSARLRSVVTPRSVADLADQAANDLICAWVPPALKRPLQPLVMVEGKTDRDILRRAAQLTDVATQVLFCTPSELDPALGGDGFEQIVEFLTRHGRHIGGRVRSCPLLVLADWDIAERDLRKAAQKYGRGEEQRVGRMQETWCDRQMTRSIKGIERLMSPRIMKLALEDSAVGIAETKSGDFVVTDRQRFDGSKVKLAELFLEQARPEDCTSLRMALDWVEKTAGESAPSKARR